MILFPRPLPDRCTKRFFSNVYYGNLVELLEANLMYCGDPLSRGPPGIFLSTLSLQQFVNYNSGFPILTVVSVTVSA